MHDEALRDWRQECDAVEHEMDRLIRSPVPGSAEERQVRRIQFVALVERREDAARKLIQTDRARFRHAWRKDSAVPGDYFISARHATSSSHAGSTSFVKLPDGRSRADVHEASLNSTAIAVSNAADPSEDPTRTETVQSISASSSLDPSDGSEPFVPADADVGSDPASPDAVGRNTVAGGEPTTQT